MMQPFILMEQYRSSLTPRTQRRSQNICSDTAKIQTLFETTKFWSSKCREKLVLFALGKKSSHRSGSIGFTLRPLWPYCDKM